MNIRFHAPPPPGGYRDAHGAFDIFWTGNRGINPRPDGRLPISQTLHALNSQMHTVVLAELDCATDLEANARLTSPEGIIPSHAPDARAYFTRLIALGVAEWVG